MGWKVVIVEICCDSGGKKQTLLEDIGTGKKYNRCPCGQDMLIHTKTYKNECFTDLLTIRSEVTSQNTS